MMVDLDKMNEVDYFDEKTFLYCEEPILAERLLKKKIFVCMQYKGVGNSQSFENGKKYI